MRQHIPLCSILLCGLLLSSSCVAQSNYQDAAFVSAHAGGLVSLLDGFENIYNSRLGFAPGISVGVPVWRHLYLVVDATYFSKEGRYIWALPTFVSPGALSFRQLIFNAGAQYDLDVSDMYSLDASAGLAYTAASEIFHYVSSASESGPNAGTATYTAGAVAGYFGALSVERAFRSSPVTIFVLVRYSFTDMMILGMTGNGGGTDVSAGLRYYFKM
jgi:hypothetical protein